MNISESPYGQLPTGQFVSLFTLTNSRGSRARVINYGGILQSLEVPDRSGALADVVLGKDRLEDYLAGHPHFGAITGRVAGRIKGGVFSLDGATYQLEQNNLTNCLHGGNDGFDKQLWAAKMIEVDGQAKLELKWTDPAGHNNFPGTVQCTVTYALLDDDSLELTYRATTDAPTPFNLTNHSYFNLNGHDSGDVLGHEVQIDAAEVASVDELSTLLGRWNPVLKDYNDYREPVLLADRPSLNVGNADIYYRSAAGRTAEPKPVAEVYAAASGRRMTVLTTEPGVQFYAGLSLSEDGPESGKGGCTYPALSGLCMETQDYADSVNFPKMGGALLRPGEVFQSRTIYRFDIS